MLSPRRAQQAALRIGAIVRLDPHGSLERRADRLRARRNVRSVRWQPGAARLDGLVADRLTWVISHGDRAFEAGGTWRRERPLVERFLGSVRLVPANGPGE